MKQINRKNQVQYRDVAKLFCSHMPVEGEDYHEAVEATIKILARLPKEARIALKTAYIFASKVPHEEREDMLQEFTLTLLQKRIGSEKLAYAIARCDWQDWWRQYYHQHELGSTVSLNILAPDEDGDLCELGDLIVGECEFELKLDGEIEAERIWLKLPDNIKPIVQRRLLGYALKREERTALNHWVKRHGHAVIMATA